MKNLSILFILISAFAQSQMLTPYEKGNGNQTTTFDEMRKFYQELSKQYPSISYETKGEDDNGAPIDVVIFNPTKLSFEEARKGKSVLLVNNGIHPGEPDGIDATMMLMRDLAIGKIKAPNNVIFAAIASYNISGMMNRGSFSRANQNGPEEYGFRGNARNYDLNRDFIKTDSKNSRSFQQIFQWLKPDVFIDNHVSNGADYQYTFTYISTNKERLGTILGNYFNDEMQRTLLKNMEKKGVISVPYVNIHGDVPDGGFPAFVDSPRYATGYTTLFNIPGTVAETHMLKKYSDRVHATYEYMLSSLQYLNSNYLEIRQKISENSNLYKPGNQYPLQWKLDSTKFKMIDFKGYEAGKKPSEISGKPRLFYDRTKPFTRKVKFYDTYSAKKEIVIPNFYVIPKSENKVLEAMERNQIEMKKLTKDSLMNVTIYSIADYKTTRNPYEGHYLHYDVQLSSQKKQVLFRKGDYLVSTNQTGVKYILETLEPEATDSFFAWNFFDSILGQKEYYSDYVFEDTAAQLLKTNPELKAAFEKKKKEDAKFAESGEAQLDWMYRNSPYYEGTVNQYPIYRIE
ncbi:hypothetical protein [uncultured Chryseobacterium sp.]|uniref:hypothetical protein n=1 Tax=uncultured Chryseobacterium sp. TaxID=259322 RepID=UPI002623BEB2|nr:hypothetical protein [uncultured Chryseobacterium sp.]